MPTENQKRVAKAVLDKVAKGAKISISKEMREAGYSESVAAHPEKITKSQGWKELMEEYLPDTLLGKKHLQLLEKQEVYVKNNNKTGKIEVIPTGELDTQAVKSALDMAYKLKKKYDNSVDIGFKGVSDEKLRERAAELIAGIVSDRSGTQEEGEGESS